jgi:nitrite reductase/ring-hydroxylating ferredoxin subunit
MSAVLPSRRVICALDDLPDPGALEFSFGAGEWPVPAFVVRYRGEVHAYVNRCPHAGYLLNWGSNSFFAPEGSLLTCTAHGAMFEANTGECVAGPCIGQGLHSLEIEIVDGQVLLREPPPDVFKSYWSR